MIKFSKNNYSNNYTNETSLYSLIVRVLIMEK